MIVSRPEEVATLRECGRRLASILAELESALRPGLATIELDRLAERLIAEAGGAPVFRGYRTRGEERPFPATLCVSINDEVVHGIPRPDRVLVEGDLVGLDIGMRHPASGGLITDAAITAGVGAIAPELKRLAAATADALRAGITAVRPGAAMGDVGHAIQSVIAAAGFGVVRELVGHGVGRHLHEPPYVPNYGAPGRGVLLPNGMVIAIEPMATIGGPDVKLDADGWTWRTKDGSRAAHFEHTVMVTKDGAEILTKIK